MIFKQSRVISELKVQCDVTCLKRKMIWPTRYLSFNYDTLIELIIMYSLMLHTEAKTSNSEKNSGHLVDQNFLLFGNIFHGLSWWWNRTNAHLLMNRWHSATACSSLPCCCPTVTPKSKFISLNQTGNPILTEIPFTLFLLKWFLGLTPAIKSVDTCHESFIMMGWEWIISGTQVLSQRGSDLTRSIYTLSLWIRPRECHTAAQSTPLVASPSHHPSQFLYNYNPY